MKTLDQDPDFLDLLAAWHENKNVSPSRRAELLQRLENDERLRIELAREIEMVLSMEQHSAHPKVYVSLVAT